MRWCRIRANGFHDGRFSRPKQPIVAIRWAACSGRSVAYIGSSFSCFSKINEGSFKLFIIEFASANEPIDPSNICLILSFMHAVLWKSGVNP